MTSHTEPIIEYIVPEKLAPLGQFLPQLITFQGLGKLDGGDELEYIVGDVIASVRLPLIEAGRNIISFFILEREEDGDFLFTDHDGATFGIGPSFRSAFEDWHASATELLALYSLHVGAMSEHVASEARLIERALELNEANG